MNIWSEAKSLCYIEQEDLWDEFESQGVDFSFPLQLIEADGRVVGGIQGQESNGIYTIGYFFIFEKGCGYGARFVHMLKAYYPRINGYALSSSILFWEKTGMTFVKTPCNIPTYFEYEAGA